MQPAEVIVFPDSDALALGAAERIAGFVRARAGATVSVGLAGGSTPAATYRALLGMHVPWDRVYAWIGDERFVPPDHPDNNGAMVRSLLIDHTDATFFPVPWDDDASPEAVAAAYERTLAEVLTPDDAGPRPDLLLAGIGDDGHTLSLFPGTAALDVSDRWFVANWVEQKDTWRLTTTYPLAWRAEQVYVLVSGSAKAETLGRLLHPDSDPLPARRLMEHNPSVTWLVDEAAATHIADLR